MPPVTPCGRSRADIRGRGPYARVTFVPLTPLEPPVRTLSLKKEVLAELSTVELTAVVGGARTQICATDPCITPPISQLRCSFSLSPEVCGG